VGWALGECLCFLGGHCGGLPLPSAGWLCCGEEKKTMPLEQIFSKHGGHNLKSLSCTGWPTIKHLEEGSFWHMPALSHKNKREEDKRSKAWRLYGIERRLQKAAKMKLGAGEDNAVNGGHNLHAAGEMAAGISLRYKFISQMA